MTITSKTPSKAAPRRLALRFATGLAAALTAASAAAAPPPKAPQVSEDGTRIAAPYASFSGLDKITGRIISFDVAIDETVQFGALQVTPRVCYSRPQTVAPLTTTFVEVDEITLDNKIRRIFTGWMFADSPGLHAVEHPVYDVWLTDCKTASNDPAAAAKPAEAPAGAGASDAAAKPVAPRPVETTPSASKPADAAAPAAPKPTPQTPPAAKPAAPKPAADAGTPHGATAAPLPSRSDLPPLQSVPPLR